MDQLNASLEQQLSYYEQLQKQLDARETKQMSIYLRHKYLERQKIANYQNEYDRIRGIISDSVIRHGANTFEKLKERQNKLKELGAMAID